MIPGVDRPNILFLMSDQHRADVAGFAGDAVVRTPTLDRLACESAVFTSAYTPSPICVPARQCLMAGQLPRTCGVERFGQDLPPFSMTFAKRLAQFGYTTACVGKLHHMGPEQMQGWTHRIAPDAEVSRAHYEPIDDTAYPEEGGTGKWTNQKEVLRAGVGDGPYQRFDERARAATLDFIRDHWVDPFYDRPAGARPTLLKVSLLQPHYPFFADADKFEYYLPRVVPYADEAVWDHPSLGRTQHGPNVQASPRELRRATAAYYAMVEKVDTIFGDVLAGLERAGHDLDDWWIVYTSDHGEMLGEHGLWEKSRFFEGSVKVPLLIRPPRALREAWGWGGGGRAVDANVSLIDLFATLCEAGGAALPAKSETVSGAGLDGRSLVPLMSGEAAGIAGGENEAVSQFGGTDLMIRRGDLKYLFFASDSPTGGPEVLIDLGSDPGELRNAIDEPRHADAVMDFRERRGALGFGG
ncbi:MAG: sulfatase-like hydrolase/transferase [Planctomycetota bacterium]